VSEVQRLARQIIARREKNAPVLAFHVCDMRPNRAGHIAPVYRWVTTDSLEVVEFFRACWNARHELAVSHD